METYQETITCTRRFSFDAAHRVLEHESKCKYLHGHRWEVEITCSAPRLDNLGRVIDFGEIKRIVGMWIDESWDHNLILNGSDPLLDLPAEHFTAVLMGRGPYILHCNPTAENLASHLHEISSELLNDMGVKVSRVRVYETPNCYADYSVTRQEVQ